MSGEEAKEFYGETAQEWLDRWDAGRSVWTIEMGGMGPEYEQAIQVAAAEIIRFMLSKKYDSSKWSESEVWQPVREEIYQASMLPTSPIMQLGLSGAQYGAAVQVASFFYMKGPAAALQDPAIQDRHIPVSKNFPSIS